MNSIEKLAVVTECDKCPNVWYYLGLDPRCLLANKKTCWSKDMPENKNIPDWCPLPDKNRCPEFSIGKL